MLVSFTLVALPLIVGLIVLFFQIDRLSTQMQTSVNQSAAVMENSRLVTTHTLQLKRSAEQYLILRDSSLLSRYHEQRPLLKQSLNALLQLPIDAEFAINLKQVQVVEDGLKAHLQNINDSQSTRANQPLDSLIDKPLELDVLGDLLETLPAQASSFVSTAREGMAESARRTKRSLIVLIVTLIPTAIVLALLSSAVINRPVNRIISLLRQLGAGEYPDDTYVGGPENIEVLGKHIHWLSERLSEIEQQKVTFLQNVSHELKTPLTAIREGADLMQDQLIGKLNPEQIEVLEIMNQNTYLLQNQLESLLDFNLSLSMDEPYPPVPVNIKLVIEKIIGKLQLILKSRQITIEHDTPPARVIGNQAQLESMFENILTNAIKFSPKQGKIRIITLVDDSGINVVVEDMGPGFHNDEIHKVFRPFFQGQKTPNSHIKGTGLGLSIAKRYADLHGGKIEIANSAIGAAVKVLLPINSLHQV